MIDSNFEKTNLEAHVAMSNLRDEAIKDDLTDLRNKIEKLIKELIDLKDVVSKLKDDHNRQIITWGSAIIIMLISALGSLLLKIILPMLTSSK